MRTSLNSCKRIVVKVGTSTLMYPNGNINLRTIEKLARVLSELRNEGKEVVLVSSGAIGVGLRKLQLAKRPASIPEQQAIAAVGQSELMHIYSKFFGEYGYTVGQVLLTRDVTDYPTSRKNVINTFNTLIRQGTVPIVNENDTVAVEEIEHITKYGDNDRLSAIVAKLINAELLIMLSDIDGFYHENPLLNPTAEMFDEIHEINDDVLKLAGGSGSDFGTGGMLTKLAAAEYCMQNGQQMVLANGDHPEVIYQIIAGEKIGTLFTTDKQGGFLNDPIR
ncbi:gamma-glutamyl kinase [Listeria floridensis FSL S10-1187]|uniref:Glutamate 5-kinase n=1 Tax=Listeria floridensis FSL S10-1187 TaxID=1265817 RepID=A0ABP3AV13_9LIST|nr:glutamate 5-kinase [Listeria floridensis]EUJ27385.1 gamma-glutamyl kinase [Listeria floridensis FSL S10-1187]